MAGVEFDPADLVGLRLLVDTARTGSLSAAARAAGIAQPSASAALRRLERRLGVTLLARTPRGSRPTLAGQRVVHRATEALAALAAVSAEAASLRAEERHEVRVAASYTIAEYLLPARLPKAAVLTLALAVVNSTEVVARVRDVDADVGFVEGPVDLSGLRALRIGRDELVVVTAAGRPWAERTAPLSPDELADRPLLLREPESGTRLSYEDALRRVGRSAAAPLGVLSSTEALKAAVRAGVGDTVLSRLAVAAELDAGTLAEVPVAGLRMVRELRAVWRSERLGPLATAFLTAVTTGQPGD